MQAGKEEIIFEADKHIEKPLITTWSSKEREIDLAWIHENLPVFKEMALAEYDEQGPGIIIVHTFQRQPGGGHPFGYLHQSIVEEMDNEDVAKHVRKYDPQNEVVVMLLKSDYRESTYRVKLNQS